MTAKRVTLFVLTLVFVAESRLIGEAQLSLEQWVRLALAGSFLGRAAAYLLIFDWARWFFVIEVPHSSGAGADNHPKHKGGVISALCELIVCPVCAAVWGITILMAIYKVDHAWAETLSYVFSAAAIAWLVTYATEWVEWSRELARERVGQVKREQESTWIRPSSTLQARSRDIATTLSSNGETSQPRS